MRRKKLLIFLAGAASALALAFLVYQIPAIHSRLNWRFQILGAYLGGIVNPADQAPTPQATLARTISPGGSATSSSPATREPTATQAIATPTQAPTPTPLPAQVSLQPPAYEKQGINNCGPAAMSMYLRYYGWEGDQYTISDEIKPLEADRNVNVEELAYYVSNYAGWLTIQYRVGGNFNQVRAFLAAGIPVVLETTFHGDEPFWPNDDLWAGHYLLITAYDDARQVFTTQDTYYGADKPVSYDQMDEDWQSFNRVMLLVYPPDRQAQVEQILGSDWDVDQNRQNALDEALAETAADPQDAFAWFNLGSNLVYFSRYSEAADAYDTARAIDLPQRMYRYQFGPFLAYFHSNRDPDLLALTEYALERTPNSEEALLWHGWALYRQGDLSGAASEFQKALEAHPDYGDAQYALDFVSQ